ncbi:MAG: HAMP domain-containing sensor histidine kinase [Pseudomonadota bacterium]
MLTEREKLLLDLFIERYRHCEAGRLVKGIVHNMNNVIHTLSMQVELLKRRLVNLASIGEVDKFSQEKDRCLDKISDVAVELGRLNELIGNIVSKGVHDDSVSPGPVEINSLLSEELTLRHADMFYKHKVQKSIQLCPEPSSVYGYHVDLSQALDAIIQNALEAMENSERRDLSVTTNRENGSLVVSVRDTGCGLPGCPTERLFEPFYTTKDLKGGHAGLGLYLARQLLVAYGGEISLRAEDVGTTVRVILPFGSRRA